MEVTNHHMMEVMEVKLTYSEEYQMEKAGKILVEMSLLQV